MLSNLITELKTLNNACNLNYEMVKTALCKYILNKNCQISLVFSTLLNFNEFPENFDAEGDILTLLIDKSFNQKSTAWTMSQLDKLISKMPDTICNRLSSNVLGLCMQRSIEHKSLKFISIMEKCIPKREKEFDYEKIVRHILIQHRKWDSIYNLIKRNLLNQNSYVDIISFCLEDKKTITKLGSILPNYDNLTLKIMEMVKNAPDISNREPFINALEICIMHKYFPPKLSFLKFIKEQRKASTKLLVLDL